VSAEGVTLSGVLWNTKLCTDTTLESPIQLGAEGAKMADRAIPISQAKGQGWHWVTPIVYVDAYMHTTAGPSHTRLECGGFVFEKVLGKENKLHHFVNVYGNPGFVFEKVLGKEKGETKWI